MILRQVHKLAQEERDRKVYLCPQRHKPVSREEAQRKILTNGSIHSWLAQSVQYRRK